MKAVDYDAKALGASLRRKLRDIELSTLSKEEINSIGLEVLKVAPKDRCDKQLETLRIMTSSNKFFNERKEQYGEYTYSQMIKNCYLEFVPEGQVLFEAQTIGYEFFIILKGQVGIGISLKGPDYEEKKKAVLEGPKMPKLPEKVPRFKSKFDGVPKSPANPSSRVIRTPDGYVVFLGDTMLKDINTLGDGASFGEVAIMGNDVCTRNATIFCKKDCYFAVLDKQNFQRIIGEHTQRDINMKVNFLKSSPVFSCLADKALNTLIYFLTYRRFHYREIILRQGDLLKEVVVIKSGSVKLVKRVGIGRPELNISHLAKPVLLPDNRLQDVILLSEGEVVGEEYIKGKHKLPYSAICDSETCEVFFMDKAKFLARVDDDLIAQDAFRSVVKFKSEQFSQLQNTLDNALNKVVEEKVKQDQEEKIKKEAGALSDGDENGSPRNANYTVKTAHGEIPILEQKFRERMGNDQLQFLGDMELLVNRKVTASEVIEKTRELVRKEEETKRKLKTKLVLTEGGLVSRRSRVNFSPTSTRRHTKSGIVADLPNSTVEKSIPTSAKISPRHSTTPHRILRPFEPKRFTPASTMTRPKTPHRLMLRSRGEPKKLDLKVDVKSFRSCAERSFSHEPTYKYLVSDQIQSSPEPSQEIFSRVVFRASSLDYQNKTSGTLEEYNTLKAKSRIPSTNYTLSVTGQPGSAGLTSNTHRRGSDKETLRSRELVAMINRHRQKNISTMFSDKIQKIRGSLMFSTYN